MCSSCGLHQCTFEGAEVSYELKGASFSVVVVGAMNPSIHHPIWYRHVGLLDEQEEKVALEKPAILLPVPMRMASFETESFQISCQHDRWQILTTNPACADRILSLTEKLFDVLLSHTPVTQFGYNFDFTFGLGRQAVARMLGHLLCGMSVDLGINEPISGDWRVTEARGNCAGEFEFEAGHGRFVRSNP